MIEDTVQRIVGKASIRKNMDVYVGDVVCSIGSIVEV